MSVDGNRDNALVTLQYLILRTNLLSELNNMRREYFMLGEKITRITPKWDKTVIEKDLNYLADRKAYLLDIAKQGLSSDDYAQFKDLVEDFKIGYWEKRLFRKTLKKTY